MRFLFLITALLIFAACNQQPGTKNSATNSADSSVQQVKPHERDTTTLSKSDSINSATSTTGEPANKLISAGKSLGNIELGMNDSQLEALGKPDMSDAAMGKAWLTWYGKKPDEHNNKTQLNVYTAYKDTSMRAKTVQQVRTTSSFFETADGLHVYTALHTIKQQYPTLKKVADYMDEGRKIDLYDVQQEGIAFEIANAGQQQICTGIIIHKRGVKVTQVYISLHPDMHRI